jgi:two-component system, OmpR family, KDP operon response regulator KdpE
VSHELTSPAQRVSEWRSRANVGGARILVIDDEQPMLRSLRLILGGHGYAVTTASTGEDALAEVARHLPDVILLDLMLPGMDGLEVCRKVRERSAVPVIVLSARGEEQVKVQALELGADDYLTKPFGSAELIARVRVALRHAAGSRQDAVFKAGDLRVDLERRVVTVSGRDVMLTPREYDVLKYLVMNAGKVLTHTLILRAVWGPKFAGETQYLRNVVLSLRRKLETDPARPAYIITEPGIGYRLRASPQDGGT